MLVLLMEEEGAVDAVEGIANRVLKSRLSLTELVRLVDPL